MLYSFDRDNANYLLSVIVVLLPLGILLPLGMFASSLPPLIVVYKINQRENQWRLKNTSAQRYADYYNSLLTSREVVLDEPTSAMDAWAESNWLKRLRNLAKGKTVIIITHRFTTAQQADLIHVMAKGRTIESGTHQELLAKGNSYTRSWRSQVEASAESKARN